MRTTPQTVPERESGEQTVGVLDRGDDNIVELDVTVMVIFDACIEVMQMGLIGEMVKS